VKPRDQAVLATLLLGRYGDADQWFAGLNIWQQVFAPLGAQRIARVRILQLHECDDIAGGGGVLFQRWPPSDHHGELPPSQPVPQECRLQIPFHRCR